MNRSSRYGGLHLKSFQEIKKIYESNSRIFDLESFQHKFIQLMRRWTDIVLPTPTLSKLAYGAPKKKDEEGAAAASPNATKAAEANDKENVKSSQEDEVPPPRTGRGKRAKRDERKPPPPAVDTTIEENEVNDEIESSSSSDEDAYEEAGKMGAREALKRKREAFVKKIKDPMKDIVAAAEGARGGPKEEEEEEESEDSDDDEGDNSGDEGIAKRRKGKTPSFRKQKKSAHQLNFTDSDNDSSDEEEDGVALSKLPTKYKAKQEKKKPTKIHITRKNDTVKKRKRFTEEEDGAIRLGVERFGAGNWAQIKAYYSMELIDRTTINLKDRWRTLNK